MIPPESLCRCCGVTSGCVGPECPECRRLTRAVQVLDGHVDRALKNLDELVRRHAAHHEERHAAIEAAIWAEPIKTNSELVERSRSLLERIGRRHPSVRAAVQRARQEADKRCSPQQSA